MQETAELPPTLERSQTFMVLAAGGALTGPVALTWTEDDVQAAPDALADPGWARATRLWPGGERHDPLRPAGLRLRAAGAWTCGIANNPGAPLLEDGDLGILLDTGPEVLTGSTRLKAGTAQKLALNRITTAAMVLAGRVVAIPHGQPDWLEPEAAGPRRPDRHGPLPPRAGGRGAATPLELVRARRTAT